LPKEATFMKKKIETNVKDLDKNEEVERRVMCSVGLLYQKIDGTQYTNKVRVCFVDYSAGDDEYIIKAKGEKYFAEHPDFKDDLNGFVVVAWQCTVGENT
jgi:hypothetical protein